MDGHLKKPLQPQSCQPADLLKEAASKRGRAARGRGAAAERELSKILTDELGFEVKRKLGQARDGGDDIQVGKYRIEVKRREALRLDDWCQQIEACCDPREVPIVAYRRNGQPWRAVVPMAWLIAKIREDIE